MSQPTPNKLRVLIVRHGETRENVQRIIQGQLDTDLNDRGRQQAEITGQYLSSIHIDRIISSPLKRVSETAKAIHRHRKEPTTLEYDDRLKERKFGVLEGKVYAGNMPKPEDTEGIELMEDLSERLASFWNDLITRTVSSDSVVRDATETVVVVSHGGAIGALMNQVLVPGRYCIVPPTITPSRFWNCSITELLVPVIHTTPTSSNNTVSPGDLSRKRNWSIRPIHLGVQGSQFLLDHSLQKKLLATAKAGDIPNSKAAQAVKELEALVTKTEQEFERDPQGKKQLEADTIKAPDGKTVENDIGYGRGVGVVVTWSNVDHLKELDENAGTAKATNGRNVNVDELVK